MARFVPGPILLALAVLAACGSAESSRRPMGPPPAAVEVVTLEPETLRDTVRLPGELVADESVMLKTEISGVVESIGFVDGQEVPRGTLLFRLDDGEQRARVAEAEAAVALTEQAYRRARSLAADNVLAAAELDRATAERDSARARLELARVALRRTEIRAPFDGVLGARMVSVGDRVSPQPRVGNDAVGTGLVQLDAIAHLKANFVVPEVAVPAVRVGMPVQIEVAAWPGERFAGEVSFVSPTLDARNRRLALRARIPNPERRLRPGFFIQAHLEIARHDEALVAPESAVVYDADGTFVWRLDGEDAAERIPVTLGLRRDGRVHVTDGLAAGQRIVSVGTHKMASGRPLLIVALDGKPTLPSDAPAPGGTP